MNKTIRMTRDELIDKMARAMTSTSALDWESTTQYFREVWRKKAAVALDAISVELPCDPPLEPEEEHRDRFSVDRPPARSDDQDTGGKPFVPLQSAWRCSCGVLVLDEHLICPMCGATKTEPIQATEEELEGFIRTRWNQETKEHNDRLWANPGRVRCSIRSCKRAIGGDWDATQALSEMIEVLKAAREVDAEIAKSSARANGKTGLAADPIETERDESNKPAEFTVLDAWESLSPEDGSRLIAKAVSNARAAKRRYGVPVTVTVTQGEVDKEMYAMLREIAYVRNRMSGFCTVTVEPGGFADDQPADDREGDGFA